MIKWLLCKTSIKAYISSMLILKKFDYIHFCFKNPIIFYHLSFLFHIHLLLHLLLLHHVLLNFFEWYFITLLIKELLWLAMLIVQLQLLLPFHHHTAIFLHLHLGSIAIILTISHFAFVLLVAHQFTRWWYVLSFSWIVKLVHSALYYQKCMC